MQIVKGRVLPLLIDNSEMLRAIWMPFILSGAVFVPDVDDACLGELIFLLLLLPGATERIPVSGQVVWVNPAGTAARRGIGVRLQDVDGAAKSAIEKCLENLPAAEGRELFMQERF